MAQVLKSHSTNLACQFKTQPIRIRSLMITLNANARKTMPRGMQSRNVSFRKESVYEGLFPILSCHDSVNHARHQCVHDCMNSYDQCQTSESCSAKNASIIGIISDDKCQNSEPCSASMSKLWINVKTLNEYNALALSPPPHRMAQVPAGSFDVWKQRCTKGSAHCCLS